MVYAMADDSERMKRVTHKLKKMTLLLCWLSLLVGYVAGAMITHNRIELIVRRKVMEILKQEEE
jgi:hypothetical protein